MTEIAESAGCRIVYEHRGQGSPVLFIQGVGVHGAARVDALLKEHLEAAEAARKS